MSQLPPLRVGFDLPFGCQITAGVIRQPLIVTIYPARSGFTVDQCALIETHVQVFMEAALYGLGAGRGAMPQLSMQLEIDRVLQTTAPTSEHPWLRMQAAGLAIDPAYVLVLLHKLRCIALDGIPIGAVSVAFPSLQEGSQTIDLVRANTSDLPEVSHYCQFERDFALLDTYYSSCCVSVDFAGGLAPASFKIVEDGFKVWVAQCLQGGYTSESFDCDRYSIVPGPVILLGDRIEWSLDKVDIDGRAFNAVANFLTAVSRELAPVTRLVLE